jgi:hypothetical protein
VLTTLVPLSREIESDKGTWYLRRILPYQAQGDRIEGVVITFADISELKVAEREIEAARAGWNFSCRLHPSLTSNDSSIVEVTELGKAKKRKPR